MRVPECEILIATHAVKNFIRNRDFFKISAPLETGADHGMWSFQRYRTWLENRNNWYVPGQTPEPADSEAGEPAQPAPTLAAFPFTTKASKPDKKAPPAPEFPASKPSGRIEIEPVEGEFGKILKRPGE